MQVRIKIRGRQYTVRGDESSEDIRAVAADLDTRMEEVASRTSSFDEYTVAVLTALNLSSEIRQLRQQIADRLDELDREAASVSAILDAAVPAEGIQTSSE